jgi:hypothetical protein
MVLAKPPNKAGQSAAEAVEERGLAKENAGQQNTHRTQCRARVPSALEGVRRIAKRDKGVKFTALFHHITLERLRQAFLELNKKAAAGVDGVTWEQYEANLEENLQGLHGRLRRGAYRAKSSRRVYIPEGRRAATTARSSVAGGRTIPPVLTPRTLALPPEDTLCHHLRSIHILRIPISTKKDRPSSDMIPSPKLR